MPKLADPTHVWTMADLDLLPDDGHRYEIVEGKLHMAPAPSAQHQVGLVMLSNALLLAKPAQLTVAPGVGVNIDGRSFLIPDLVVYRRGAATLGHGVLRPEDVLLAVEFVSPSTRKNDRVIKPDQYAMAGIDAYWRVESTRGGWEVYLYRLVNRVYVREAVIRPGAQLAVTFPFPVVLAPANWVE